jgi:radical SAM superfamily enzyme YgiQ (UPF0313 family)
LDKIILINPPDRISLEPMTYPPLGLLYVAARFERSGYEVEIFDMRDGRNIEEIGEADAYGFTATTPQINDVMDYVSFINKEYSYAYTYIGGSHATHRSEQLHGYFDFIKMGNIDIGDMFPPRHLMPKESIVNKNLWAGERYQGEEDPIATTMFTSFGCPWTCAFCANIPQKVIFRTPIEVLNEINIIKIAYDCNHFRFLDDNFLTDRKRVIDLCDILDKQDVYYRCSARSDLIDEDTCKMLYKSGCREIGLGIETADDHILTILNKRESVEDHKQAIKIIKDCGMDVKIFMMAGLPFETDATIEKSKQFIEDTQPDKIVMSLFTPFPGSDIYEHPDKYHITVKDVKWNEYSQAYPTKSIITTEDCSSDDLTGHYNDMIKCVGEYNAR